ncbi:MAG: peptide chain release factor N(5)-glutamine methyltransferase [Spirochaetales bacterium]
MFNLLSLKRQVNEIFIGKGIDDKSETDWLFCNVLKISRTELLMKTEVTFWQHIKILRLAKKRARGIPLSHIFRESYFYGLTFKVNKSVLTPRKETELLVEQIINDYKGTKNKKILDLCTGSGAIAVALSKNLKDKITASDISNSALKVARHNIKHLDASVTLLKSDLFENITGKFNAIVSNPPYIKTEDIDSLQVEVKKYDPLLALDGGNDGLDFFKEIIKKAPQKLEENGRIYLEVGKGQAKAVSKLLEKNFINIKIIKDYSGVERIVYATKGKSYDK